ncbi:hypothetical protein XENOCAPTIV_024854, partial [Xenoophorus captivus]
SAQSAQSQHLHRVSVHCATSGSATSALTCTSTREPPPSMQILSSSASSREPVPPSVLICTREAPAHCLLLDKAPGRILAPSSCATLTDRSPWNFFKISEEFQQRLEDQLQGAIEICGQLDHIQKPQPIACLTLPAMFHRGREPGCGYQACCEPQMCCLHSIPGQPELATLDKSQMDSTLYNSSCVQPANFSASLSQSQQLQRFWETESSLPCPPPTSPLPGPIQLSCSQGSASQEPRSLTYVSCHQLQREIAPDSHTHRRSLGQRKGRLSTSPALQHEVNHNVRDKDVMSEESWEERCRGAKTCTQTAEDESRELLDEELEAGRRDQSPVQQHQLQLQTCLAADQQRTKHALTLRVHRDGKSSRLSPNSVCTTRKRRSRSIPTELVAPSSSPYTERPAAGCMNSREAVAAKKVTPA